MDLKGSLEPLRNLEELVILDVEACFGLQGVLATLPKLRILNTSDTRLEVEGFVATGACRIGRFLERTDPAVVRRELRAGVHGAAAAGGDGRPAWC